ncbi:hypothetical protein RHMOL_Rhmol13G0147500 [Rhododendron molle]|uniref:Uncharacterized protein n=1 Tax=Rhododendron molle TaxID=49168 RepID=A0ACC0L6N0_RHOML|nr:hypothetical protein RHMOL_Rhmol13G0147500 [Rhododendron molle]
MEEEQGPNIVSMKGSSPSIDPFFDPFVSLDFEIESNSIGNHMMVEEKKDIVMDIVCWKPCEEVSFSVYNGLCFVVVVSGFTKPSFSRVFDVSGSNRITTVISGDASTHGSHIGRVTEQEFTTENVSGSHMGVYNGKCWTVTVFNGNHNHPPAKQLEGHDYPARLSSEQSTMLVDMCVSSLSSPREILSLIKGKDEFNVSSIKTIYNARYKHGFKDRAGRSQMQYLLGKLQEYGYIEFNRKDENDCLKDLFWSHPTSGDMLRAFPRVLLMDCTYKTNRYRFPLL